MSPGQQPAQSVTERKFCSTEGHVDLDVIGESHYQDCRWRLVGGRRGPEEPVRVGVYAALTVRNR